jgi:hypothetical protein
MFSPHWSLGDFLIYQILNDLVELLYRDVITSAHLTNAKPALEVFSELAA